MITKRALVTGGAGFIGTNLVSKLLEEGWNVTILDDLSRKGSEQNLKWLKKRYKSPKLNAVIKDIRDYSVVKKLVAKSDVVFHLASQVAVTTSFINPREDFEVNVLGSLNVLEAARESKHKPIIVFASTNKVYGQMEDEKVVLKKTRYMYKNLKNGITEHVLLDFHSPYGCSKGAADQYMRDYSRLYGLPTVVFRQSCIYGPYQMGIEDQGWVAHLAIATLFNKPITLYGDGKQVRDLLYIDDLIRAYLLAIDNIDDAKGRIYNIGGGVKNSLSLLEYFEVLEDMLGKKVNYKFADWRPGDQKICIMDTRKIKRELGWKPEVGVKQGLKGMIGWITTNAQLFDYSK